MAYRRTEQAKDVPMQKVGCNANCVNKFSLPATICAQNVLLFHRTKMTGVNISRATLRYRHSMSGIAQTRSKKKTLAHTVKKKINCATLEGISERDETAYECGKDGFLSLPSFELSLAQ